MQDKEIIIDGISSPHWWMSFEYPSPINWQGYLYATAHHLLMALRFAEDSEVRALIRQAIGPDQIKEIVREHRKSAIVKLLSDVDVSNASLSLNLKLQQHPHFHTKLMETGSRPIVYEVTYNHGNLFWGAMRSNGGWLGKNMLGVLWEQKRKLL